MLDALESKPSDAISIADLARGLGVSAGAPYRHFAGRDALLNDVAAIGFDRLRARMTQDMAAEDQGSIKRIVAGGMGYINFSIENPHLFNLMWSMTRPRTATDPAARAGERAYMSFLTNLMQTMEAEGFGDEDPMEFGAPIWTMVHGYASLLVWQSRMLDDRQSTLRRQLLRTTRAVFAARSKKRE
ncbi:MAG: TetR/AcrR family transcriptional regulator [Pseudomonadota bacterium]